MSHWQRPQGMKLARRLEQVVAELRRCAPELLEVHVRSLQGMATTAHLASQPRRLHLPEAASRREPHV